MGLQKYRADKAGEKDPNGSVPWYSHFMGGPSLALIRNCPTPFGRRTVYIRGGAFLRAAAEVFFTLPAACRVRGRNIYGYLTLTCKDGIWEFHAPIRLSYGR